MEHVDDSRKSVEGYKSMADPKGGEISHYLVLLYNKVIEQSLLKHSKRSSSEEVCSYTAIALYLILTYYR